MFPMKKTLGLQVIGISEEKNSYNHIIIKCICSILYMYNIHSILLYVVHYICIIYIYVYVYL